MTFREFLEASKAVKNLLINNVETDMLTKMRQEGFTDEEIYNMLMPKLWTISGSYRKLFRESFFGIGPINRNKSQFSKASNTTETSKTTHGIY